MQKMKKENGVTLVALVITIIVTMILASVSIDLGIESINSSKDRNMQAELEVVQQAVIQEYTKAVQLEYTKSSDKPLNFVGTEIVGVPTATPIGITWALGDAELKDAGGNYVKYKSYYTLTPQNLEELEIDNSDYTYIVNYYTGEVYNTTKEKTSKNQALYIRGSKDTLVPKDTDTTNYNDW